MSTVELMSTVTELVVGAYAASPAHVSWDERAETAFYEALAQIPRINGLELPWLGALHPHDGGWLMRHFPARYRAVFTGIPHAMRQLHTAPTYGLASTDEQGRQAAVFDVRRLREDCRRLNDAQARHVVRAVELHSAPTAPYSSSDALAASLTEIASWEWEGTELLLEHCDAWRAGVSPEKGFLALETEMDAIAYSRAPIGIVVNWGRSAIEERSPNAPEKHVKSAADRGLLRAVVASGAADVTTDMGSAWADAHLPVASAAGVSTGVRGSLMTPERLARTFRAAGPLEWVGVKVGAPVRATLHERVATIAEHVELTAALAGA